MRARKPHIDEKRAEPAAGFNNAFIAFIATVAHKIGRRADQRGPARCGAHCKAAPDLYQARFDEGAEEGRRIALDVIRCDIIELRREMRKLRGGEREPIFHAIIGPDHIRTIPHQLEADRRENIPPEGRSGCHCFTKTKGACRHGARRRAISALRRAR